jgi:hypothetical protein
MQRVGNVTNAPCTSTGLWNILLAYGEWSQVNAAWSKGLHGVGVDGAGFHNRRKRNR